MHYQVAERFISVQGEGQYTGTLMGFVRFVGCSVGKKVCHFCDTDFDEMYAWKDGGSQTDVNIVGWAEHHGVKHLCLTGGEPLDHDLRGIFRESPELKFHIETSGTVMPDWLPEALDTFDIWLTVSPKPGYLPQMLQLADEIKVIVGGLGTGEGWPTPHQAVEWTEKYGVPVFLQPRNKKYEVDPLVLTDALGWIREFPELCLSVQMHKFLKVR